MDSKKDIKRLDDLNPSKQTPIVAIPRVYPKNSFDRFGDNLCELIVSHLSIECKLRFECISKKWNRLAVKTQKKLIIRSESGGRIRIESDPKKRDSDESDKELDLIEIWGEIRVEWIRRVLKKFRLITDLDISLIDDRVLNEIIDNCHQLTRFRMILDPRLPSLRFVRLFPTLCLFNKEFHEFGQKFGQHLKSLSINGFDFGLNANHLITILRLTPNLETFCADIELHNLLLVPVLSKLRQIECKSLGLLDSLAVKYKNQIRKMTINLVQRFQLNPLIDLKQFSKLEELKIITNKTQKFAYFGLIASQCKQLKVLSISSHSIDLNTKVFKNLAKFESLEKLKLSLDKFKNYDNFAFIHSFAPNLKVFSFDAMSSHLVNSEISDELIINLSKLQNLTEMVVRNSSFNFQKIGDSSVGKLVENCRKLNKISISYELNDMKIIEILSERAKTNPKIEFEFDFCVDSVDEYKAKAKGLKIADNLKLFAREESKTTFFWDNYFMNLSSDDSDSD